MKKSYIIVGAIVAVMIIAMVSMYNGIVTKHQGVEESWANIETTLQRRYDLIPNLVNTVKGYATHEKETLQGVVEARAKALNTNINVDLTDPKAMESIMQMQGSLEGVLGKLMAIAESYPDLKASQNFLDLQSQLEGTENRINVARTRYNANVKEFNSKIMRFPTNIVNNIFLNFEKFQYFKAVTQAQNAPKVEF